MEKITDRNFVDRQKAFLKAHPTLWLMIRPDRPFDPASHRYDDDQARQAGDAALRAWFEYLAAKGFIRTFKTWRAILKSGKSIMVVCGEPLVFDPEFIPPAKPVLKDDFWTRWDAERTPIADYPYEVSDERDRIRQGFRNLRSEVQSGSKQPRVRGWTSLGAATKI